MVPSAREHLAIAKNRMLRLPDMTVTVESCAVFVMVTMLWISRAKPENVSLSVGNSVLIPLRIAFLHGVLLVALMPFPGVAIVFVPVLVVACLCLLPLATIQAIPGGSASAFSVGKMLLIPLYAIRQFVLGFPDRDLLRNHQPARDTDNNPTTPFWVDE